MNTITPRPEPGDPAGSADSARPARDDACAPSVPMFAHAIGTEAAADLAAVLKALAEPLRLRMLSAIAADGRGETCVCDLAELAEVSQPTVSHHLKVLRDVGVLVAERRATWVWYRIAPGMRPAVTTLLDSFAPATVSVGGGGAADRGGGGAGGGVSGRRSEGAGPGETRPADAAYAAGRSNPSEASEALDRVADGLADEFPDLHPEVVLGVVRESHTCLARSADPAHLGARTDRFARQRLADLTRIRARVAGPTEEPQVPRVLFVCVANAGRSQLAAALVEHDAAGRVLARSAGSAPAGDVHPHVRVLLDDLVGRRAADAFPKPLTDDAVRAADVVVTMGCGDVCPVLPGVRYEDWAVGDPALASDAGAVAIRDEIAERVRGLLRDLAPEPELDEPGRNEIGGAP